MKTYSGNYDTTISRFHILFEGLPDPVFYGTFYPVGDNKSDEQWEMMHFSWGLKDDKDPDYEDYEENYGRYREMLRNFVSCAVRDAGGTGVGAVVAIPSSTKDKLNRVTHLVRDYCASAYNSAGIVDATHEFVRTRDKATAHAAGGKRSILSNMETLAFLSPADLARFDFLIVVDDILTSGSSFRAADEVLRRDGFEGQLFNFAFAHTFPSAGTTIYDRYTTIEYDSASRGPAGRLEGIVFDLDQTLVDDAVRDIEYEERDDPARPPYGFYQGVDELMDIDMPFVIASRRDRKHFRKLANRGTVNKAMNRVLQRCTGEAPAWYEFLIGTPVETADDGYRNHLYKPCPDSVLEGIEVLHRTGLVSENGRVVGVGNTLEDMMAYREAGLESVLALWGVPDYLKAAARATWGADRCFETVDAFASWCAEGGPVRSEDADGTGAHHPVEDLSDDELGALPSITRLIGAWKSADDADAEMLKRAKMNASKANTILERHGYLTPAVDGNRRVTEKGRSIGIIEHQEPPRNPKSGQELVPVIRYSKGAEEPVKRVILAGLDG